MLHRAEGQRQRTNKQRNMDQDAFRSLLSKPSAASGSGTSQARVLGAAPKRGWTGHSKPVPHVSSYAKETKEKADRAAAAEFKPRRKDPLRGRYKDRAEARRLGLENEFDDVEKLKETFEDAGGDEEKRAFLGGDAKHSVLVKGLDRALLAQRKAELEQDKNAELDSELEALAHQPNGDQAQRGNRTKADILAELKASQAASLGSKFKSIASAPEKKKKKKKKKVDEVAAAVPDPTPAPVPEPAREPTPPPAPKPKAKRPKFAIEIDEDDDDIFKDVEEYKLGGPSDDDDEDDDEVLAMDDEPVQSRSGSRAMSLEQDERRSASPRKQRSRSRSGGSRTPPAKRARISRSPSPITYQEPYRSLSPSEDEDDGPITRLVPLESSALPSVRDLLALDSEAAQAEAKKAKKAKWRAAQGLAAQDTDGAAAGGKEMTDKQKLNREHQMLQNHMAKKQ